MNILAFGASNHQQSINRALALHAAQVFKAEFCNESTIDSPDLNDYEVPIFSVERNKAYGAPTPIRAFFEKIQQCDVIIIAYAEYNGIYTSAWKNIFDWMSVIDQQVFQNTPMVIMATSPGSNGAHSVLDIAQATSSFCAANIKGVLSLPSFYDNFDLATGSITNETYAQALRTQLATLVE